MLLSPPSPPSPYRFSPQSPAQPTASSSTRSLSVITVPHTPYPSLQSYSYASASESSLTRSDPSPKTSAFFRSPFESPESPPSSQSATMVSKTAAFFSAPFAETPTPLSNRQSTPREVPSSSRSLTADFFASTPFSSCPTSPPSLRSSTSNSSLRTSASSPPHHSTALPPDQSEDQDSTPVPKARTPLLSRLFPSRFSSNHVRRTDDAQRGFVDLDPPEDVLVASPAEFESPSIAITAPAPSGETYDAGAFVHPDNEEELSYRLVRRVGQGAFSLVWLALVAKGQSEGTLVAVKMIARAGEQNDGAAARRVPRGERVSFMREVEVLHYLSPTHASLPRLYASFTVRTHHVLVLEYVAGGELLDVVNSDEQHAQLNESLLRRIWCELVSAVEWMHARFVVHRDIKLENILLTANPFVALPPEGKPLVKLTDFGLSRKIDPDDPWLSTRCGSESYAAPELLVAAHSTADAEPPLPSLSRAPSDAHHTTYAYTHVPTQSKQQQQPRTRTPGTYDGRETDAWALGVVLFALVTRALPFDPPLMLDVPPADADAERARRRWVLRVVRGEWAWPAATTEQQQQGRFGTAVRDVVGRLLVSDPRRRARVGALWDEPWMGGQAVVP